MKSIILSIKHRHNENIHSGAKTNELTTNPPEIECPFKVYNFDTLSSGGCGKVVSEWICDSMETYRICMGIPKHLLDTGCVTSNEIMRYTNNGDKDLTAMHISNLKIYDKPKELSEFYIPCYSGCSKCEYKSWDTAYGGEIKEMVCTVCNRKPLTRPPQSWCYAEEV